VGISRSIDEMQKGGKPAPFTLDASRFALSGGKKNRAIPTHPRDQTLD
jgi:hypothetical protein